MTWSADNHPVPFPCRSWTYFMPGMLVYFVDLVFRAGQYASVTTITAADVKPGGSIVTLQLKADQARKVEDCDQPDSLGPQPHRDRGPSPCPARPPPATPRCVQLLW